MRVMTWRALFISPYPFHPSSHVQYPGRKHLPWVHAMSYVASWQKSPVYPSSHSHRPLAVHVRCPTFPNAAAAALSASTAVCPPPLRHFPVTRNGGGW